MRTIRDDLRSAWRAVARRPGLIAATGLTLSLGIGASTAMFSVVQSVLIRPLPFPESEELVAVYPGWPSLRGHPTMGALAERGTWSWPEFFAVSDVQDIFTSFAAFQQGGPTLTGDGPAQRVAAAEVTADFFPMLGVVPAAGRLFSSEDGVGPARVILSHGAWRDRYGSDPGVIGRTITLDDTAHEVIGVLPPDFRFQRLRDVEFWLPKAGSALDPGMGNHGGQAAIGRLAPGVSPEAASDRLTAAFDAVLPEDHGIHEGFVYPLQEDLTHQSRGSILIMLAASVMLLLVAFANAAALLLGAGLDRARELAVRAALGASRSRLIAQLLGESALLGLVSVAGGLLLAAGLSRLLLAIAPTAVPGLDQAAMDVMALGFAAGSALVFTGLFGLIPALSLSGVDLAGTIGAARAPTARKARLQSAVVVGQLGAATVLVVTGLLLGRTVSALDSVDPGFAHEELATVAVAVPSQRFVDASGESDPAAAAAYRRELADELRSLPGVEAVTTTSAPPFTGWRGNNTVWPEGYDLSRGEIFAERRFVSPGFFDVAGVELIEGTGFDPGHLEADAAPVVVISEGLADLGWPDGNAVGGVLSYWGREATVLGVARNLRDYRVDEVTELAFYAPGASGPFLLRAEGDPAALVPAVRERVWGFDEDLPILVASATSDLIIEATAAERYRARLMAVFALISCVIALLGIYGVTARAVSRRTREIGVRVALGAEHGRVWSLVARHALRLGVAGAVIGVLGSVAAGGLVASFLYGVEPSDPLTMGAVLVLLPLASVLAAAVPARRATRIDPIEALQAE